jgi:hypothetical protein
LIQAAQETGADVVGSSVLRTLGPNFTIAGGENIVAALGSGKIQNRNVWSKLFRRTLFERSPELIEFAGSNRIVHGEDAAIVATVLPKTNIYHHVEDVLVNYTRRIDSSTKQVHLDYLLQEISQVSSVAAYIDWALRDYDDVRFRFGQRRLGWYFIAKLHRVDEKARDTVLAAVSEAPNSGQVLAAFTKAADRQARAATLRLARLRSNNQGLKERLAALTRDNHGLKERVAALKIRENELKTKNRELRTLRGVSRTAAVRFGKAAVQALKLPRAQSSSLERKDSRELNTVSGRPFDAGE